MAAQSELWRLRRLSQERNKKLVGDCEAIDAESKRTFEDKLRELHDLSDVPNSPVGTTRSTAAPAADSVPEDGDEETPSVPLKESPKVETASLAEEPEGTSPSPAMRASTSAADNIAVPIGVAIINVSGTNSGPCGTAAAYPGGACSQDGAPQMLSSETVHPQPEGGGIGVSTAPAASPRGDIEQAAPCGTAPLASPGGSLQLASPSTPTNAAPPDGSLHLPRRRVVTKVASSGGSLTLAQPSDSTNAASPRGTLAVPVRLAEGRAASPGGSCTFPVRCSENRMASPRDGVNMAPPSGGTAAASPGSSLSVPSRLAGGRTASPSGSVNVAPPSGGTGAGSLGSSLSVPSRHAGARTATPGGSVNAASADGAVRAAAPDAARVVAAPIGAPFDIARKSVRRRVGAPEVAATTMPATGEGPRREAPRPGKWSWPPRGGASEGPAPERETLENSLQSMQAVVQRLYEARCSTSPPARTASTTIPTRGRTAGSGAPRANSPRLGAASPTLGRRSPTSMRRPTFDCGASAAAAP